MGLIMVFDANMLKKRNPLLQPFYNCEEYLYGCFKNGYDINWDYISQHFELPNWFIAKNKDKLNWYAMTLRQNWTEEDVREFKDYIIWNGIQDTDWLSREFIREFANELNLKHRRLRKELNNEF